jgi:gas vesicle protein
MTNKYKKTILIAIAGMGIVLFLCVQVISRLYDGAEIPAQFSGALLGAIVTAAITMALLHGQSQAEELKERNVKVFEEKTRRYNDFIKKLWNVWSDRRVTLEELNDLMESVSQDIIIYTKESSTEKLLKSLTDIAKYAGETNPCDEDKEKIQKYVFDIINTLSEEMNLGGKISDPIRESLNALEKKVRPLLIAKEYRKKLLDEIKQAFNMASELPFSFGNPKYEVYNGDGDEYIWAAIIDTPLNLCFRLTAKNPASTIGIGLFVGKDFEKFDPYRQGKKGTMREFLHKPKFLTPPRPIVNFNDPQSLDDWVKKYNDQESPGKKIGEQMVQYVKEWEFSDGKKLEKIIA